MKHGDSLPSPHFSHPSARDRGFGWYYTLGFTLWFLATLGAFVLVLRTSVEFTEREFKDYAEGIHTHLRDKLSSNEVVLYGFASFLGAIGETARDSTRTYARAILERHPHIYMLEIVRKLPRRELESYSAQLRRAALPNFRIRQFGYQKDRQWHPLPEKDTYYPIVFMEPELPQATELYGLDMDSQTGLKEALLRSEEENIPVSSAPFQTFEGEVAYVMFRPVIASFAGAARHGRENAPGISYAMLVMRTMALLPPRDKLPGKIQYSATRSDARAGSIPLFAIAAEVASDLEQYLLPRLYFDRSFDSASQPFVLHLEQQLRYRDINLPALTLAGMASILSFALLFAFLHAHDRQYRQFQANRRAIEHMALHDALTGLPNRFLMLGHLEQAISLAQRHGTKVAVLFLDLDGFKPVNDQLGHPVGDAVLKETARRLQACVRDCDTASRYGGDEFVVLLTEIRGPEDSMLVADKLLKAINEPLPIHDGVVRISTSIGIAIFPNNGSDAEALIDEADQAMYRAKQKGPGHFMLSRSVTALHGEQPVQSALAL